jgi:dTDP-4-dehydrorhamnose reductase
MATLRPILVTGGSGQLARALGAAGGPRVSVVGRPRFDFDRPETIAACVREVEPALVINAAAWTAVDLAETEPAAAWRANEAGPAALARLCAAAAIPLIHISTDYVFDGDKGAPYLETDPTGPTGVYGASKLAGEIAVLAAHPSATILRTSWVYAAAGKNFVRTMLALSARQDRLRVVADQRGCPSNADDLAAAVLAVADRTLNGWQPAFAGVFHAAGDGATTWHGLAEAVFAAAGMAERIQVAPITTADYPTAARRPPDSRLDCGKLAAVFGVRLPPWRPSLERTVADILRQTPAAT